MVYETFRDKAKKVKKNAGYLANMAITSIKWVIRKCMR